MDDLIYDAVSIFTQILMQFAPDYLGNHDFLLAGYIFACAFVLLVIWSFCRILSAFARVTLSALNKGG